MASLSWLKKKLAVHSSRRCVLCSICESTVLPAAVVLEMVGLLRLLTWPVPSGLGEDADVTGTGVATIRVCPHLKEIHCPGTWKTIGDVPWSGIRDLVKSRKDREGCSGLEVVSMLGMSRDMGNDVLQQLSNEDRGALHWLVEANRSGLIELRLKKLPVRDSNSHTWFLNDLKIPSTYLT